MKGKLDKLGSFDYGKYGCSKKPSNQKNRKNRWKINRENQTEMKNRLNRLKSTSILFS